MSWQSFSNIFKSAPKRTIITAALVPAATFLGLVSLTPGPKMTADFEGMVLKNYLDVAKVETWCIGETQMGRLEAGYTPEYCRTLFSARYSQYSAQLYACYSEKDKAFVTPMMHAAFTDVYYNTGAKCNTSIMRALKRGDPVGACEALTLYRKARVNGALVDCSARANGCYSVWDRRVKFKEKCLEDAKKLEGLNVPA